MNIVISLGIIYLMIGLGIAIRQDFVSNAGYSSWRAMPAPMKRAACAAFLIYVFIWPWLYKSR